MSSRSPNGPRRRPAGGGAGFLMAAGVALAGLAIGVHFSATPASPPKEGVRERGSEGVSRRSGGAEVPSRGEAGSARGRVATARHSRDVASQEDGNAVPAESSRPATTEPRLAELPTSAPVSGPARAETAPRSSPNQHRAEPDASVSGARADAAKPAPPTDELSPGSPLHPFTPSPAHPPAAVSALEVDKGPAAAKRIALTFDAGSSAAPTPAILEALKANGLRCTFFLTGRWTEANPEVVRQIVEAGHELGNHTYTHPDLTHVSDDRVKSELQRTEDEVQRVTGRTTKPYFRPPFGARDARVLRLAAAEGYRTIYWTTDSWDSVKKGIRPREIEERVLRKARPGSIILMHCGSQATADALPDLIRSLKDQGYEIVTVSDLLGQ